ncbi:hypothetical protein WMY93_006995 [Mugilogobius chulae]|uniref:Uncharacterized protein n=1 Tax=Mugilogobius chulae TaxID=88201 RepID=A0AAW0PLE0_9GOBI
MRFVFVEVLVFLLRAWSTPAAAGCGRRTRGSALEESPGGGSVHKQMITLVFEACPVLQCPPGGSQELCTTSELIMESLRRIDRDFTMRSVPGDQRAETGQDQRPDQTRDQGLNRSRDQEPKQESDHRSEQRRERGVSEENRPGFYNEKCPRGPETGDRTRPKIRPDQRPRTEPEQRPGTKTGIGPQIRAKT